MSFSIIFSVYPRNHVQDDSSRTLLSQTENINSFSSDMQARAKDQFSHSSFYDDTVIPPVDDTMQDKKQFLLNQFKMPNKSISDKMTMHAKQHQQPDFSNDTCITKTTADSAGLDLMDLEISSVISSVNGSTSGGGKRRRIRKRKKKNGQRNTQESGNDENEIPTDSNATANSDNANDSKKVKGKGSAESRLPCFTIPNNQITKKETDAANTHIR